MEKQQKTSLKQSEVILFTILIMGQIAFIFWYAYDFAVGAEFKKLLNSQSSWDFSGLRKLYLVPPAGLGLLLAVIFTFKRKPNVLVIISFIIAGFTAVSSTYVEENISPLFASEAKIKAIEIKSRQDNFVNQSRLDSRSAYDRLLEEFKTPKKVVDIHNNYPFFLLENGQIVTQVNFRFSLVKGEEERFIKWSKDNLIGKYVTVSFPNPTYEYNSVGSCTNEQMQGYWTSHFRKKNGFLWNEGGVCSGLDVNIYFEGELLVDKLNIQKL